MPFFIGGITNLLNINHIAMILYTDIQYRGEESNYFNTHHIQLKNENKSS